MDYFQKGQNVKIYDDAISETVDLSLSAAPYGAPGLLWNMLHDGFVRNGMIDLVDDGDNGTFECLVSLQSSVEDFISASTYDVRFANLNGADIAGGYAATLMYAWFEVVGGELVLHLRAWIWHGAGLSTVLNLTTDPASQTFEEGQVYRFSVTWAHSGGVPGTTTVKLYVDGTLRDTDSASGYLCRDEIAGFCVHLMPELVAYVDIVETYMADMRLYSAAQSQATIDARKFTYLTGAEMSLICYWKIDEGTGTSCEDLTAGGNDGLIDDDGYAGNPEWGVAISDWTGTYDGVGTYAPTLVDYTYFNGRIDNAVLSKISPDIFETRISCSDYSARFDERLISANISNRLSGDIIKTFIPRFFSAEGVGCRTVSDGSTIVSMRLKFDTLRKMMDDIKRYSAFIWYVDAYKELRFHDPFDIAAPFNIDNATPTTSGYPMRFEMLDQEANYANRVVARASSVSSGVTIYTLYVAQVDSAIAARAVIEGGSGIHEMFTDLPTVTSDDHGEMMVLGILTEALLVGTNLSYITRYTSGLRVGMTQHVKHTEYGIDDDYIIIGLTFKLEGGYDPQYTIQLSSSRAYQELGNQIRDMVDAKSNFKPTGMTYVVNVPTGSIDLDPGP